ncbi:MAG: DEAD/DEAH box helicase, partial [Planctomycetes bacterium]|nr:DEAD/DEAH box helicase [Planctomycetota bacterium]
MRISFDDGTLCIADADLDLLGDLCVWDSRINQHRAPAIAYAEILRKVHGKVTYQDDAKAYNILSLTEDAPLAMRPYQRQALEQWKRHQKRGVVVLPTGAGKTYVAVQAIIACQRSAIILAPTIDLVQQWAEDLQRRLQVPIGQYGGGEKNLQDITVATYDSGILIMPHYGNRFGLIICDECHHLPSAMTSVVAESCIAPFRLGLTATPERTDGQHHRLHELLGPMVHKSEINELEGKFLANYQAEVLEVAMDDDEFKSYKENRQIYLDFVRVQNINFSLPDGWQQFIMSAARSSSGREVMAAYREQKRLARASRAKLRVC